jgi:hypothetical protein
MLWISCEDQPLVIFLDTFEQVEAGGPHYVGAVRNWLKEVVAETKARVVRVVVSGRGDPDGLARNERQARLAIGELRAGGAMDMLGSRGILRCSKTHVSNALAGRVPGIPRLTHLAMGRRKLVRRESLARWMDEIKK